MPLVSFIVYDDKGKAIFGSNSFVLEQHYPPLKKGESVLVKFAFQFPKLHNGTYVFSPGIVDGVQEQHIRLQVIFDAYVVTVMSSDLKQKQGVLFKLDSVTLHIDSSGSKSELRNT